MKTFPLPQGFPEIGAAAPWNFPDAEEFFLQNGLRVWGCHIDGPPVLAVRLFVNAPFDNEPSPLEGLAAITARALQDGTEGSTPRRFLAAVEQYGATFDFWSEPGGIVVAWEVASNFLLQTLQLFAHTIMHPAFTSDSVTRIIQDTYGQIDFNMDEPETLSTLARNAILFSPECRAARPETGSKMSISRIKTQDVAAFWQQYGAPQNSTLIICGNLKQLALQSFLEESFGEWSGEPSPAVFPATNPPPKKNVLLHYPKSVQTQVQIGQLCLDSPSTFPAQHIVNYILGQSTASRLFLKLREEKGYTYGMGARIVPVGKRRLRRISAGIKTDDTANALLETYNELEILSTEGITPEELTLAKAGLLGQPRQWQTPMKFADSFLDAAMADNPIDYLQKRLEKWKTMSLEEVNSVARTIWRPENLSLAMVGDASILSEPLQKAGVTPLEIWDALPEAP